MERSKHLQVIIKTIERCNINCTYCYVFNMQDDSYLRHPAYISQQTIGDIIKFLQKGSTDLGLKHITFIFIGGEPLMQKKKDFISMCSLFNSELGKLVKVCFSVQTNGMLIDEEWISIFNNFRVGVGISLDGNKIQNDRYRVDHKNRGTYDRVASKISLMKLHYSGTISLLSVVNPENSAKEIYQHFSQYLGVKKFDFLLPDYNYENKPINFSALDYGQFLCDLFDVWIEDLASGVSIRLIGSLFNSIFFNQGSLCGQGPARPHDLPLISISSNGELAPMDELRNTDPTLILDSNTTIVSIDLKNFIEKPIFTLLDHAQMEQPSACQQCCWRAVCNAGALPNRYSHAKKFDNPSIYCDGLKLYYSHVSACLLKNGYGEKELLKQLGIHEAA